MQPPTGLGTGPWTGTPALWSVSSPEAQTSPGRCCSSPGCPAEAAGTSDHPVPESRTASCQAVGAGAAGVGGGDPPSSAPGRPALTMRPRAVLPLSFWAELRADGEDREEDGGSHQWTLFPVPSEMDPATVGGLVPPGPRRLVRQLWAPLAVPTASGPAPVLT